MKTQVDSHDLHSDNSECYQHLTKFHSHEGINIMTDGQVIDKIARELNF
jgi:hypothetical protein